MKEKLSQLFRKSGFHIILFVCVCIVAVTGIMIAKRGLGKKEGDNLSGKDDFVIEPEEDLAMEIAQMEDMEEDIEEDEEDVEEEDMDLEFIEDQEQEQSQARSKPGDMIAPVDGKIGVDFTKDELIYSETLEEWTNHKGIDIFAKEGQEVKAAASGKVLELYDDQLWGRVLIIDHGNGLISKYANLSTVEVVAEGTRVDKGVVIGKVGNTAAIEMIMEPHIHFEVIKDGVNMDPKDYIPALSHLK